MHVRIKILHGSNAGKEVKIPVPKCMIGRGDDCHLRPQSDAISRRHCVIVTTDSEVVVRDLNSRNGTFVNGERVTEESVLLTGDILRVGPLEFEMQIEHTAAKIKRSKVSDIKEAVSRTAETAATSSTEIGDDVSDWLDEGDKLDQQRKYVDPDTRQFSLGRKRRCPTRAPPPSNPLPRPTRSRCRIPRSPIRRRGPVSCRPVPRCSRRTRAKRPRTC